MWQNQQLIIHLTILHTQVRALNEHMLAMCKGMLYQLNLKWMFMLSGVTVYTGDPQG